MRRLVGSVMTTQSGLSSVFLDDALPAEAVAVLLLHGADDPEGVVAVELVLLDELAGVDHRGHAGLLVGGAAAPDHAVGEVAAVRVVLPLRAVADPDGVDGRPWR
jgi:hypothetical protein